MTIKNRFNIDFFEFSFLVEACIPPVPIARAVFWGKVLNEYYKILSQDERDRLYEWLNLNYRLKKGIEDNNVDCMLFNARYDRSNQYMITATKDGKTETFETFKFNNRYHVSPSTSIEEQYIINIEPKNK